MEEHILAIVGSGFVLILVADLIGNFLTFSNRFFNALVTSVVWGVLFFALNLAYDKLNPPPLLTWEWDHFWWVAILGVILAFISDFVGNSIAFKSPYRNALVTACVWVVAFYVILIGYIHSLLDTWVFF
jgi:H+/Cl- antiporter ClcA